MLIYWTLKNIPELSQLSSQERKSRWRRAYHATFKHWETWVALVLCGMSAAIGSHYFGFPGAFAGGLSGGFLFSQISITVARKYHRAILTGYTSD